MQNHKKTNQEGYTFAGVLISIGAASGLALIAAQLVTQSRKIVNPIKNTSYIMDLKHYINNNFNCEKTMEIISCDGKKVQTYRKNGEMLTDPVGTDFYRNQEENGKYEFLVNASCNDGQFDFFYTYKTPDNELEDERHLFDSIPIVCEFGEPSQGPCEEGVDVVTFEDYANGDPVPNDAFQADYGITLNPVRPLVIAKNGSISPVDEKDKAFLCNNCPGKDVPNGVGDDSQHEIGKYFLTDEGKGGTDFELEVNYDTPVTGASGSLLDLDGKEEWIVKAYSGTDLVYNKTFKGKKGDDSTPTVWKVENDPPVEFDRLVLVGKDGGKQFGLAFDNFSPSSVCDTFSLP